MPFVFAIPSWMLWLTIISGVMMMCAGGAFIAAQTHKEIRNAERIGFPSEEARLDYIRRRVKGDPTKPLSLRYILFVGATLGMVIVPIILLMLQHSSR
jgi:hypothetical protein